MRKYALIVFSSAAIAISADLHPIAQSRTLELNDFYAIKQVGDLAVSPDGRWAVYVVREILRDKDKRVSSLWRVPVAGGAAERLTHGEHSDSHPKFSADGGSLAFISDRSEKPQIFILPSSGGEAFQVTELKEGVSDVAWAPDSRRLVVVSPDPKDEPPQNKGAEEDTEKIKKDDTPPPIVVTRLQHKRDGTGYLDSRKSHLYVVPLDETIARGSGKTPASQLTRGPFDESHPAWSPDGSRIAFSSNRTPDPDANENTDIWIIDVGSGRLTQVTTDPGEDDDPVWSPDGGKIAYVHLPSEPPIYATPRVMLVPAAGGNPVDLTGAFDRHVGAPPRWSSDGRAVFVTLVDHGHTPLVRIGLDRTRVELVSGNVERFEVVPDHLVAVVSTPTRPGEVYGASLSSNSGSADLRPLTRANAVLDNVRISAAKNIHFKSADGTPIEGWVIEPPDFSPGKKYPLILRVHGGPVGQFSDAFSFEHQYLASLGYLVVYTNPRGSNGYGEAFCKAIFADWGNKDYEDVMAGVDYVIAQGSVDPKKLGVGGWSYGAIMTNYIITKTPRFAAATSGASEADMFSAFGYDDLHRWWVRELGAPWDNVDLYRRLSPIMSVKKIVTPTLVMCGEKDFRCPLPQSEQLYLSLKTLGRETALIIYPGQSHGIRQPSYEVDRLRRYGYWYDKFLLGKDVNPTYEVRKGQKKKTN